MRENRTLAACFLDNSTILKICSGAEVTKNPFLEGTVTDSPLKRGFKLAPYSPFQ